MRQWRNSASAGRTACGAFSRTDALALAASAVPRHAPAHPANERGHNIHRVPNDDIDTDPTSARSARAPFARHRGRVGCAGAGRPRTCGAGRGTDARAPPWPRAGTAGKPATRFLAASSVTVIPVDPRDHRRISAPGVCRPHASVIAAAASAARRRAETVFPPCGRGPRTASAGAAIPRPRHAADTGGPPPTPKQVPDTRRRTRP